jgi:transposase
LHDTLFSFFFVVLPKNFPLKTRKRLLCFDLCPTPVDQAYTLVQQFANPAHERAPENGSTIGFHRSGPARTAQLQGFVLSVVRDKAAVVAGLTLPQNNGLVEGKVNKLKLIKRMMYGRAEFPLLRQRVLHAL